MAWRWYCDNENDIPQDLEYVELNDIYFNQNTARKLDDRAQKVIEIIDEAKLISKYKICSKFNDIVPDVDKLSAGCKTVLNVLYNPDKVFCLKECGNNALVPLKMTAVNIQTSSGKEEIYDDEQRDEQNTLILK